MKMRCLRSNNRASCCVRPARDIICHVKIATYSRFGSPADRRRSFSSSDSSLDEITASFSGIRHPQEVGIFDKRHRAGGRCEVGLYKPIPNQLDRRELHLVRSLAAIAQVRKLLPEFLDLM